MIETAKRLDGIGEYYFSQKLREIDAMNQAGKSVINLGIGSPDLPPHPDVMAVLQAESAKPNVHAYQSYKGSPVLRKAVAKWYENWYGVNLNPETDILPLIGSKEGIMHICMTYLNPGDKVLVPNPGYPTYRSAVKLAGGECVEYELTAENDYQPKLATIDNTDGSIKLLFVNYPHMPTGQLPTAETFRTIIDWARRNNVLVVHDNPYSFILNNKPSSLLSAEGATDVVIELNSLSKSHNMAGWRVGVLVGAKQRIEEVLRFKSNMDSGMFLPIQLAAATALGLGKDWYASVNHIYSERREMVYKLLDVLNCTYSSSQAGMFVWASIPKQYSTGYELSDEVLRESNVFITPGGIFGSAGEKYVRVSLCSPAEKLQQAIERIELKSKNLIGTRS